MRRLADKTQVFPLDKNDSVRNRLTHSYEVSNLARSFGTGLCYSDSSIFYGVENACRDIPSLLAAIGLVHDLGNPPFGHQGEAAIQHWFNDNQKRIINSEASSNELELYKDFQLFEGNAQGFRLITRLQLLSDTYGLNLTYATLSSMMKYPTSSRELDENITAKKKHGYFRSEEKIAQDVLNVVGLQPGKRSPFAYIMEACDDIAYVVLDAEDSVKKGLASFADLMAYLRHHGKQDKLIGYVINESEKKHNDYRENYELSPAELNDISMQRFRVIAIGVMIHAARQTFEEHMESFLKGEQEKPLLKISKAEKLRETMKSFSFTHGYTHKSVLALELEGFNTIHGLMSMLWFSIDIMAGKSLDEQKEQLPFARYVYTRISENYRRIFDSSEKNKDFPLWYHKCQLLTDMVSGMTDSYALNFYEELKSLQGNCDLIAK
ncbi:MAG: dNTP triphosphohydrolase [Opitutales bacterium]